MKLLVYDAVQNVSLRYNCEDKLQLQSVRYKISPCNQLHFKHFPFQHCAKIYYDLYGLYENVVNCFGMLCVVSGQKRRRYEVTFGIKKRFIAEFSGMRHCCYYCIERLSVLIASLKLRVFQLVTTIDNFWSVIPAGSREPKVFIRTFIRQSRQHNSRQKDRERERERERQTVKRTDRYSDKLTCKQLKCPVQS